MKNLLLIDSNQVFTDFLSLTFKEYPIKIYAYPEFEDLDYQIKDLTPAAIFVDMETIKKWNNHSESDLKNLYPNILWIGKGTPEAQTTFSNLFGPDSHYFPIPIAPSELTLTLLPVFDL